MSPTVDPVAAGLSCLVERNWQAARESFEAALTDAIAVFNHCHRYLSTNALLKLAGLRNHGAGARKSILSIGIIGISA